MSKICQIVSGKLSWSETYLLEAVEILRNAKKMTDSHRVEKLYNLVLQVRKQYQENEKEQSGIESDLLADE